VSAAQPLPRQASTYRVFTKWCYGLLEEEAESGWRSGDVCICEPDASEFTHVREDVSQQMPRNPGGTCGGRNAACTSIFESRLGRYCITVWVEDEFQMYGRR